MKKALRKWIKNFNNSDGNSQESKSFSPSTSQSVTTNYEISPTDDFIPSKHMKLHFAVLSENEQDVKRYASKNVNNLDSLQRTPLHLAVLQGNVSIVNILLENGANPEAIDNEGFTPFLRAVEFGNVELVKMFCSNKKSNKNQTDLHGNTALHLAVLYGFHAIAEQLLKNGFPTDIANRAGDFPIHIATQNESISTVKLLLEFGASINVQDSQRRTPLLLSIEMGNISLIELLLQYKANLELIDANGKGVKDYVFASNNINVKLLFSKFFSTNSMELSTVPRGEDSPNSERSYTLPPALKSPLSWNVLQKSMNSSEKAVTDRRKNWASETRAKSINKVFKDDPHLQLRFAERRKNKYERNAKSLSFDVGNEATTSIKNQNRSYSLTSYEILNQEKLITADIEDDEISSHEKLKHQIEDCQKALQELSLDVINQEPRKLSSPELKFNSNFLLDDFNRKTSDNDSLRDENYDSLYNDERFGKNTDSYFTKNPFDSASDVRNVTINIENVNPQASKIDQDEKISKHPEDESSDEDPPFWKSSMDGGYFTSYVKKDDASKTIKSSSGSEDSDSEKDEKLKEPSSIVLRRLKQVSLENEDLETETAVLREATEKLKYDLANYRQLDNIKEANLTGITAQLTQLDTKYAKAIEKINVFQLCMSNLEQEVGHLRHVCNKSYKINQQLMKQLKQMHEENRLMKSEKDQIADQNSVDVEKLQTDVLYWKSKCEELLQKDEEKSLVAFEMQSLFKLNLELNKISDKIKDCLCKSDLAKLQDQQQILIGETVQQILNEANHKLQTSLAEIKEEVKLKVMEMDDGFSNKTESELQIMDLENTKQRLLLEISKLSSTLKEKELETTKMKEQLEKFNKDKQNVKDEKRRQLIKKSYEDKNFAKKGIYLSAVRNYLNKSKINSTDSSPEPFLTDIKLDLDSEPNAKDNEQT